MSKAADTMYQVSTLQALSLGYTRPVTTVGELLEHGDTGLGTFEDVNGEMIVADGRCFRAMSDGTVIEPALDEGVPFSSVAYLDDSNSFELVGIESIDALKSVLNVRVEEWFGLNSMHIARIDGSFGKVLARSESPTRSQHVSLKDILSTTQQEFRFDDARGSLICVYYPAYMDGINAPGWHFHFLSEDRSCGGHVFELALDRGRARLTKLSHLEIQLPTEPAFDTYTLENASQAEIKQVEQGQ